MYMGKMKHFIATLILTIIGILFLAEQTQKAKKETQERSRKELNKMKTQDIN
jgi:putative Mn2+ efflux pump MntP